MYTSCVWEEGGCGLGWGGVMCVSLQEKDVRVCVCLNSYIFNLCLN